MADKTLKSRIVHKHDTAVKWAATNFIPKQGEIIIYDVDNICNYERMKIGDGKTKVADLPFIEASKADTAINANHATSADSATKATQDGNGKIIADTYETKSDATAKLNTAKGYTDSEIAEWVGDKTVATQISTAVSTKANASDLTSHTGNNDIHITSAERTKWNAAKTHTDSPHAPSSAQENVIESIKVNGTAQTITSKSVDITVPTDNKSLANGAGYLVASDIANKANKATTLAGYGITDAAAKTHEHDSRYYTETEVDTKFSNLVGDTAVSTQISDAIDDITPSSIGAAPSSHTHGKSEITDFPTSMPASDVYAWAKAATKPTYTYGEVGAAKSDHGTHVSYSNTAPVMDGAASAGSASTVARSDHKHPTDTSRAAASDVTALQKLVGDTAVATQISNAVAGKSDSGHTHDDRYYTETEINTKLAGKSDTGHTHTKSQITDFPTSMKNPNALTIQGNGTTLTNGTYDGSAAKTVNITPASIGAATSDHNHDSTYAPKSHTHDDRYYTESEIDTKLAGKSDSGHGHTNYVDLTSAQSISGQKTFTGGVKIGDALLTYDSTNKAIVITF